MKRMSNLLKINYDPDDNQAYMLISSNGVYTEHILTKSDLFKLESEVLNALRFISEDGFKRTEVAVQKAKESKFLMQSDESE